MARNRKRNIKRRRSRLKTGDTEISLPSSPYKFARLSSLHPYIHFTGWGESEFKCWGGLGAHACAILVLRNCIWHVPTVFLVFLIFDTSFLGSPSHQVVYPHGSMVPPWVTASHFLAGNMDAKLKPTTLSSLLLFYVFLSFLLS